MFAQGNLHKTMFLDIETVSTTATFDTLNPRLQALWSKKSKQLKLDVDAATAYEQMAGIFAEYGKIVCICLGYFTDASLTHFKVKKYAGDDEPEILKNVYSVFDKFLADHSYSLCGHNIKEFDVPYMCRRTLINKVEMPFFYKDLQNRKPWENPLIDTLHLWRFGDFKHYTSLDLLAAVLNVPTPKDVIDGSMVGKVYWQDKNLDIIATYCSKDVLTVAQILLQLNNLPLLEPNQVTFL